MWDRGELPSEKSLPGADLRDNKKWLNDVNELNDYWCKQDPFDETDEIDEPIFFESNLEGYKVIFYKDSEESKVWKIR